MSVRVETARIVFEGLEVIYRAGASKCRSWPYNVGMSQQAEVYDAMAEAATRQIAALDGRHE